MKIVLVIFCLLVPWGARGQEVSASEVQHLSTVYNEFGVRVFLELCQSRATQNVFFSPAGAMQVLSLIYNGAQGETRATMGKVFEVEHLSLEDVNRINARLRMVWSGTNRGARRNADGSASSGTTEGVEILCANSIWASPGIQFAEDFRQASLRFYEADLRTVDLTSPATVEAINHWAEGKTRGLITRVFGEPLSSDTPMVLINALYFDGAWSRPFDKKLTLNKEFTFANGGKTIGPRMSQKGYYHYFETAQFQMVRLPYGDRRSTEMVVVLPAKGVGLTGFLADMNGKLEGWLQAGQSTRGEIGLPRFHCADQHDLKVALTTLGLKNLYTSANLAGFGRGVPSGVGRIFQKAVIQSDEDGTQAAAISWGTLAFHDATNKEPDPFVMLVDRPFFFAIRDKASGTLLFLGIINDPQTSMKPGDSLDRPAP